MATSEFGSFSVAGLSAVVSSGSSMSAGGGAGSVSAAGSLKLNASGNASRVGASNGKIPKAYSILGITSVPSLDGVPGGNTVDSVKDVSSLGLDFVVGEVNIGPTGSSRGSNLIYRPALSVNPLSVVCTLYREVSGKVLPKEGRIVIKVRCGDKEREFGRYFSG